jgi:hypothetical protein
MQEPTLEKNLYLPEEVRADTSYYPDGTASTWFSPELTRLPYRGHTKTRESVGEGKKTLTTIVEETQTQDRSRESQNNPGIYILGTCIAILAGIWIVETALFVMSYKRVNKEKSHD